MLMDFGMVIRTGLYRGLPWTFVRNPHSGSWRSHRSATLALSPRGHVSKRGARRRRLCCFPFMAPPLSLQSRL